MEDYQKQAEDFLKSTETKLTVNFKEYGPHFEDDKESRDIYRITLRNKGHKFSFNFGQSINKTGTGEKPTAYDVLTCLTKYDPGDFHNFCYEFGYNEDSRKAFKIYKAVIREWKNVELLFNEEQIEKLQEIQ